MMNNLPQSITPDIAKDIKWFVKRFNAQPLFDGWIIRFEDTQVNVIRILYTKRNPLIMARSVVDQYCILSYTTTDRDFFHRGEKARKHCYQVAPEQYFSKVYDTYEQAIEQVKINYKEGLKMIVDAHNRAYSYLIKE